MTDRTAALEAARLSDMDLEALAYTYEQNPSMIFSVQVIECLRELQRSRSTAKEADVWRDLVERAHHLAVCVFKGTTKADYERARHNAAVLANAIDRARQSERNRAALLPSEGTKT